MRHAVQSRKLYRRKCKNLPKSMEMACLQLSGPVRGVPWPTWEVRSRQCFGNKSALVRFTELQPDRSMCWKALECTREDDARLPMAASFSQDTYFKSQCSKGGVLPYRTHRMILHTAPLFWRSVAQVTGVRWHRVSRVRDVCVVSKMKHPYQD